MSSFIELETVILFRLDRIRIYSHMLGDKMSTAEFLDDIRKPGAQVLSIFLFLILSYASLVFLFGANIEDMYLGLRIFLIVQIIIIIISVIQFKDFSNTKI